MLLADALVVGQVHADGRDGTRVADFQHHLDGHGRHAGHGGLAVLRVYGHAVLEPLRVRGQGANLVGLLVVGVVDDAFPGALHAPGIHVDLDEAVHGVDRHLAVLHPGNIEGLAVGVLAGFVPPDERGEGALQRRGRDGGRVAQVRHHAAQLGVVQAAHLVYLLHQAALAHGEPRVQLVALLEEVEIGHGHAVVQVVGARRQDVLALARRLVGDHRLEVGVEEHARIALDEVGHPLARRQVELRAVDLGNLGRLDEPLAIEVEQELARREVVVWPGVEPEELRVTRDLGQRLVGNALGVANDDLEKAPHPQVMAVALVVVDVAPGERRLVEVPHQRLLVLRQRVEAVRIQLHDGCVVDLLQQVSSRRRDRP